MTVVRIDPRGGRTNQLEKLHCIVGRGASSGKVRIEPCVSFGSLESTFFQCPDLMHNIRTHETLPTGRARNYCVTLQLTEDPCVLSRMEAAGETVRSIRHPEDDAVSVT